MQEIGNDNGNRFWEKHWSGERLPADVEREIRENFIRAKYQMKSWIPRPTGESKEALSRLLCISVGTSNLIRTLELLTHGADVSGHLFLFFCCVFFLYQKPLLKDSPVANEEWFFLQGMTFLLEVQWNPS